jgi:hypothetical protein
MTAAALPIALVAGLLFELASGVVTRLLAGERPWWRRIADAWRDLMALPGDRSGRERVAIVEAGGAAAALLGAGMVAAGALGVGPGDLVLLYLALAVASAGAMVAGSAVGTASAQALAGRRRILVALAEPAFAVGLAAMFLRYGAYDLEAVRGTQEVLGTGLLLAPGPAVAGLVAAALAFVASGTLRLPPSPETLTVGRARGPGAGTSLLLRLCRWSLAGATSLLAGVLLAGGGLEPLSLTRALPVAAGAAGVAFVMGVLDSLLDRLNETWRLAAPGVGLLVAAAAVAMVVLA